ncbi:MAG: Smr/MutS family protein [Steroidobacteraceae bacterium]|jgi:DNA-nicking Smr family endonuclease
MAKQRTTNPSATAPATEDALAFRAAVRDVKPLAHVPSAQGLAKPKPRARLRKGDAVTKNLEAAMPLIETPMLDTSGVLAPAESGIAGGDALAFQRPGVRTQVVRRLRRGLIPIEDELDLHGLSQTAAREQLAEFLEYSRTAGRRCVRIIHGKGYRSGARGPVLKMAVDLWLRRHSDVMAFTSARAIDGGTGAVYVLLRA